MKVLIVDDYEDTREMLKMMLEMRGCVVVEAANGLEAVEVAMREKPDLILMDLNMPVLDGWEATRRLTTQEATRHIPIVAITANCAGNSGDRALAAGARECMSAAQ